MNEKDFNLGSRTAWLRMLQTCLKALGVDDPEADKVRWVSEREQAVSMLRQVCKHHGDNDWDDKLHLADVIEKHLWRHLED